MFKIRAAQATINAIGIILSLGKKLKLKYNLKFQTKFSKSV